MLVLPPFSLSDTPCFFVALSCAFGRSVYGDPSHEDGYVTLKDANVLIRKYFKVKRTITYKKSERPKLKDITKGNSEKAIVCVLGHYVYMEGRIYRSFFNNDDDEVVKIWYLDEPLPKNLND